ncbi:MAG: rhodanese-like domain-containing protein, partial [Armatimonadota bacterium]
GHLRGAQCVPLDELDEYLDKLPKDRDIVAYCRGPYCVLAIEAVERLRAKGFRAYPTREGVREWKSLGLEIEQGPDTLGNSHSQQNSL